MSSWRRLEDLKCDIGAADGFMFGDRCGSLGKQLLEPSDDSVWAVSFECLTECAGEIDVVKSFENVGCGEEKHGERECELFRPRRLRESWLLSDTELIGRALGGRTPTEGLRDAAAGDGRALHLEIGSNDSVILRSSSEIRKTSPIEIVLLPRRYAAGLSSGATSAEGDDGRDSFQLLKQCYDDV